MKIFFLGVAWALLLSASFQNKTDAIDHLNNLNIWVAGVPGYELDDNGRMNVSMELAGKSFMYSFNMESVTFATEVKEGFTLVNVNCESGYCISGKEGNKHIEADQVSLIMKSAFAKGDDIEEYKSQYPEKAGSIVDALSYLQRFYK